MRRAIARTPSPAARPIAISSRSVKDRYRPDGSVKHNGGMPPPSLNQIFPQCSDTPTRAAASSVGRPSQISNQNLRRSDFGNLGRPTSNTSSCQGVATTP